MEEVEDTVGVDSHGSSNGGGVGLEAAGRMRQLAHGRRRHGLRLVDVVHVVEGDLAALAADALGDVDAGLGGVAGLARVEGVVRGAGPLSLRVGASAVVGVPAMMAARLGGGGVALLARSVARRRLLRAVEHICGRGGTTSARSLALADLRRA